MTYPVPLPLPTFSISPLSTISLRVRSMVLRLMSGQRVAMSLLVISASSFNYLPHFMWK